MPTSPEVEGVARVLLVQRLRLLLGLEVWRLHKLAEGQLVPLPLQPLLAEAVVDVADVGGLLLERLLRLEHLQRVPRLPVWAVEAAARRQRLRHRACWVGIKLVAY